MKAFIAAVIAMVVVACGAWYGMDTYFGQTAGEAYSTDNVRLD
jgi:hypothetical protein